VQKSFQCQGVSFDLMSTELSQHVASFSEQLCCSSGFVACRLFGNDFQCVAWTRQMKPRTGET